MKKIILIISIILSGCTRESISEMEVRNRNSGYYTLEEFFKANPSEEKKYNDFKKLIRSEPQKSVTKKEVAISFIYPGYEKSDYWVRSLKSFKGRMNALNIDHTIFEYFTRPGSIDNNLMEEYVAQALANNPDYLVFTLDVNRHKEIIERLITLGKPKIILQNITTPLKEWDGNHPLLYVGFSHRIGTKNILIPEYLTKFPNGATYSMLYFTQGFVSKERGDSFIEFMNTQKNMNLVASYYTDGQYENARTATRDIIKEFPDIDFIYACSTNIALGVVDELKSLGVKDKVIVNGWGGGSSELNSIQNGDLDFTVMRINDDNGIAMAEAIKLDINNRTDEVPTIFNGDFVLINKSTTKEEIEKLKKRSFRYSDIEE